MHTEEKSTGDGPAGASRWRVALIFVLLALAFVAAGYAYYSHEVNSLRESSLESPRTVARPNAADILSRARRRTGTVAAFTGLLILLVGAGIAASYRRRQWRLYRGLYEAEKHRNEAQDALRKSEARFRETMDDMMEGCQIIGFDWHYLYLNRTAAEQARKPVAELLGRTMMEAYPGIDGTEMFAVLRRCMEERTAHNIENEFRYDDGSTRWFDLRMQPVPEGVFILSLDITERKEAYSALRRREEQLEESEARYRMLFEGAAEGIAVVDFETKLHLYVNPALCRMFGYTAQELRALPVTQMHPAEAVLVLQASFEAQPDRLDGRLQRVPCLRKDGTAFYADMSVTSMRIDGRLCNVAFFTDVSERIKAQEELQAVQEQLLLAQKMEAVGRLAGGVAHDFNNLLTGISGFAGFARQKLDTGSQAYQDISRVLTLSERAAGLTRRLLAFSRHQRLQPQVLDLNALLADQTKMLGRLVGEDIRLEFLPAEQLGNVHVDPGQIEQVVMNLAVNARDAMPDGGKVSIETANVRLGEDYARTHAEVAPGPYVMIAFSDTGAGMDAETLSHIFEPFFTTKGPGKGTGLGLSTVYGIIKQHEGHIYVYSEPGAGTTFKIYLPQTAAGPQAVREPSEFVTGGAETVLLVEDDAAVRDVGARHLRELGYTVLSAANAHQALDVAAAHDGPIHLLLTDVVMPGHNGRELADLLTATRPTLKVLFMSGYADHSVVSHGVLAEGVPYLQKPFERRELARKVREALDGTTGP